MALVSEVAPRANKKYAAAAASSPEEGGGGPPTVKLPPSAIECPFTQVPF
jgi:hypothetical protein